MHPLTVTTMYPTPGRSFVGSFVAEQVRSIREAGICVDLLEIDPRQSRLNYARQFPNLVSVLASRKYDLVHTHHTYSSLMIKVATQLAHVQVPVILTNHEGEALDYTRETRTWHPTSLLRHSRSLKRIGTNCADFVVYVSRQLAEAIPTKRPSAVIPCGVDLSKFKPMDRLMCRNELGLPRDAIVIFYPNSPTAKGKRFALVREAYTLLRQVDPAYLLLTAGSVEPDAMPLYYNAADVVVQASFYEASPTVVKEALACEIPLVSTDSGDTREVMEGVRHCYVCADDTREFALRIQACVGHRAEGGRARLRQAGLSLDQVAQRIIAVYRAVEQSYPRMSRGSRQSNLGR